MAKVSYLDIMDAFERQFRLTKAYLGGSEGKMREALANFLPLSLIGEEGESPIFVVPTINKKTREKAYAVCIEDEKARTKTHAALEPVAILYSREALGDWVLYQDHVSQELHEFLVEDISESMERHSPLSHQFAGDI